MPFGGIRSYLLGNGITVTRTHDLDYRLEALKDQGAAAVQDLALGYDLRGNIEQMDDLAQPARNQLFSHDALSRLLSADGAYGLQGFTYDGTGNRLTQAVTPPGGTAATDTYSYPPTSHRLSAISGANPASFGYDAAGNATSKTGLAITYNSAHRASTVSQGGVTVTNVYSASGQRVSKSVSGLEGFNKRVVDLGGTKVEYHAYKFADGTINVGSIRRPSSR